MTTCNGLLPRPLLFATALQIALLASPALGNTYTYNFVAPAFTAWSPTYSSTQETRITGHFTVTSPLTGSLNLDSVSGLVYDFTDGFNDFNQTNSFLEDFPITVNSSGMIIDWAADIRNPNGPAGEELALSFANCTTCAAPAQNDLSFIFSNMSTTAGYSDPCLLGCAESLQNNIGAWTGPQITVTTPEPVDTIPALMLFAGILVAQWKRTGADARDRVSRACVR
jgi:hypothetical protein